MLGRADISTWKADQTPTLNDLTECLFFSPGDGRIWLNDQRMVLLHGSALGSLRRELIDSLGIEKARGLLTRAGYVSGARDAHLVRERWPDAEATAILAAGTRLHALEGVVKVEPIRIKFDPETGLYDGEFLWHHSSEDDEHIAAYGIGNAPACWMQTGYAIGYVSTLLGQLIIFREVSCRSMGDSVCRVLGKSVALWDDVSEDVRYLNAQEFVDTASAARDTSGSAPDAAPAQMRAAPSPDDAIPFVDTGTRDKTMVGASSAFNAACHLLNRVAATDATVLFQGESGVGKELFANMLHRISARSNGPFVAVNCAAIPDTLIESELFGVERGAFTGAVQSRPGRFERAHGGTLFLDEIGTLSAVAQGKLLRALQEGEVERVGGTRTTRVDVRVVAATHVDLRQAVRDGNFREDLFFRLNVFPIHLPPLRERRDDIPLLMNHFLAHYARKYGRSMRGFTLRAVKALLAYDYPGNIRELQNLIERGVICADDGGQIDVTHLFASGEALSHAVLSLDGASGALSERTPAAEPKSNEDLLQTLQRWHGNDGLSLDRIEQTLLQNAVDRSAGNLSAAARLLGITRAQLAYRLGRKGA
jgi:transcriptional regulator with GAF, ATPase, and Fis domain